MENSKGKSFIQVPQLRGMVNSCLKDHSPFPLKPMILNGLGRGGLFLFNHLASFWDLRPCPFIFLVFGVLRPCSFIFLAFDVQGPCPFLFLALAVEEPSPVPSWSMGKTPQSSLPPVTTLPFKTLALCSLTRVNDGVLILSLIHI